MSDQSEQDAQAVNIQTLFQDIEAYIEVASEKIENGKYVELNELGGKVDMLCQQVLALPQPIGKEHSETLEKLSHALTILKENMDKIKKNLVVETNDLQKRQKAAHSYRNTQKED
jgi:uncharacterized coiled-coil protein SlyX